MLLKKLIIRMYGHIALERCDADGTMHFFSAADFAGLHREEYPFRSSKGHLLQGYLYWYDGCTPHRLIVFEHGMGDGHGPYMKEIERLCRAGYPVFTYDHTGCMRSGGDGTNGFAQSLCDLNDCICAVKADARFGGMSLSVVGHSWGGYSTMNIAALHSDITHIVAMCGFVSVRELLKGYEGRFLKPYARLLLEYERELNPRFADCDAVETLSHTDTKALLIYSDNDEKCRRQHYERLRRELAQRENVRFLLVHNKGHKPTYTVQAAELLEEYARKRRRRKKWRLLETAAQKQRFVQSFDWDAMTAQDESVWQSILESLQS